MSNISLILLGAGESSRFNVPPKKQWLRVEDKPLWLFVAKGFEKFNFKKVIVTATFDELNYMKRFADFTFVEGGNSRQESLKNAMREVDSKFVMVSDIARAKISEDTILQLKAKRRMSDIVVPYINPVDTVVYDGKTINRDRVKLIQTPQISKSKVLKTALKQTEIFTDDSSAIKSIGGSCNYILGDKNALKITYLSDFEKLNLPKPRADNFIGEGFDVHPLIKGNGVVLGGVKIKSKFKFKAHSDGDVLIHSLIDALLGAIGFGDIGELFPDTNPKYKGINSTLLLQKVINFITKVGFEIVNVDITIIAQTPKISPHKLKMRRILSEILGIEIVRVNIKATTTEKKGFVGREEAVAVSAIANLKYFDWKK